MRIYWEQDCLRVNRLYTCCSMTSSDPHYLAIISVVTVGCLLHQDLQLIHPKDILNSSLCSGYSLFYLISLKSNLWNFKFIFKLVVVHLRPLGLVSEYTGRGFWEKPHSIWNLSDFSEQDLRVPEKIGIQSRGWIQGTPLEAFWVLNTHVRGSWKSSTVLLLQQAHTGADTSSGNKVSKVMVTTCSCRQMSW